MKNFDKTTPIDTKLGISFFGNEDNYYKLLEQYEGISLLNDLVTWAKAVEDKDYHEVKQRIHSIKGSSAYVGAGRVTETWYWMQFHYMEGNNEKMMELYPKLIESVVEFRVYYRKIWGERKGEPYTIDPEHEWCAIAKGYELEKIEDYKYKWNKLEETNEQNDDNEKNKDVEGEDNNEEIEQLDKESEQFTPLKSKPEDQESKQSNEQKYIKEQSISNKLEDPNPVSNNQIENHEVQDKLEPDLKEGNSFQKIEDIKGK